MEWGLWATKQPVTWLNKHNFLLFCCFGSVFPSFVNNSIHQAKVLYVARATSKFVTFLFSLTKTPLRDFFSFPSLFLSLSLSYSLSVYLIILAATCSAQTHREVERERERDSRADRQRDKHSWPVRRTTFWLTSLTCCRIDFYFWLRKYGQVLLCVCVLVYVCICVWLWVRVCLCGSWAKSFQTYIEKCC